MTDTDHLLSREQVAARLAVSVRSVRRYTECGRLPSVHLGRTVRYRRGDVERLIAEDAATSGQERPHDGHDGPCPVEPAPPVAMNGHGGPGAVDIGQEGRQVSRNGRGGALARAGHEASPVASQGPGLASPLAEVSLQAVEALREQLAAARAENAALREDVARQAADVARKAEAAGMWQGRARTLEEQLRQLSAGRAEATAPPDAPTGGPGAPGAPRPPVATPASPQGLWQRLRRRLAGG